MTNYFCFQLATPLSAPQAAMVESLAVGNRPVSWSKKEIICGINSAWLVQALLQTFNIQIKKVRAPDWAAIAPSGLPRPLGMKERVSGFQHPWPDYLLPWQRELLTNYGHRPSAHLWWSPGCLAGDAELVVNRAGCARRMTIKEIVHKINGGASGPQGRKWRADIKALTPSRWESGELRLNEIIGGVASGVKDVWLVELADGRSIKATLDHQFWTKDGWRPLRDIRAGTLVWVRAPQGRGQPEVKRRDHYTTGLPHHPHAIAYRRVRRDRPYGQGYIDVAKVATHRLLMEAKLNRLHFYEYLERLRENDLKDLVFLNPKTHAVHHKDGNWKNNDLRNLEVVEHHEHWADHGRETHWRNVQYKTELQRVTKRRLVGEEETFDLQMKDPHNNFVANDFVVHNSGKTMGALAWGLLNPGRILFATRGGARRTIAADTKRFTDVNYQILDGQKPKVIDPAARIVICGWETLSYHVQTLKEWGFTTFIADEIHRVKSHRRMVAVPRRTEGGEYVFKNNGTILNDFQYKDNTTAAAAQLSMVAQRRLGMTGTPVKDRLRDLWAQLDTIEPGEWGTFYKGFAKRYCAAHEDAWGGIDSKGMSSKDYVMELSRRLSLVVHSVPHHVTHGHLPPKRRQVTYLPKDVLLRDVGAEARRIMREAVARGASAIIHARLAAAASRKRPAIVDAVADAMGEKGKIVVLTGLREETVKLHDATAKKLPNVKTWWGHGDTPLKVRDQMIIDYMAHPGPCVLLGTSDSFGESINLQDTDVAFVTMLPFTPGQIDQIEGRFTRQGQRRPVLIHYLIAEGTYDEQVAQILIDKLPAVEMTAGAGALEGFRHEIAGVPDEDALIADLVARLVKQDVVLDEDDNK